MLGGDRQQLVGVRRDGGGLAPALVEEAEVVQGEGEGDRARQLPGPRRGLAAPFRRPLGVAEAVQGVGQEEEAPRAEVDRVGIGEGAVPRGIVERQHPLRVGAGRPQPSEEEGAGRQRAVPGEERDRIVPLPAEAQKLLRDLERLDHLAPGGVEQPAPVERPQRRGPVAPHPAELPGAGEGASRLRRRVAAARDQGRPERGPKC